MKRAVGENLRLDPTEVLSRDQAEQMVPLQDLMQQDPVEEAAQRHPQHEAGAGERPGPAAGWARPLCHSKGVPPVTG